MTTSSRSGAEADASARKASTRFAGARAGKAGALLFPARYTLDMAGALTAVPDPGLRVGTHSTRLRHGLRDAEGEVRRRQEEADPRRTVGPAARHRQCGSEPMRRHESERPRGRRVTAARDEHVTQLRQRRRTRGPIAKRLQRVDGPAGAVRIDRSIVGRRPLAVFDRLVVRTVAGGREERAIGLLRRVSKAGLEAAEQDRGPARAQREAI